MEIKKKLELEYIIRTSPKVLYTRLNTADGLAQWFADDVTVNNGIHTFVWEGVGQKAKIIKEKAGKFVRFQWLDQDDDSYFEFKLEIDEITSEVALIITDFSEEDAEPMSFDSSSDSSELAGEEGVEPSFSDLESVVLPLSLFSSNPSPSSEGIGVLEGIALISSGDNIFSDCELLPSSCPESLSFWFHVCQIQPLAKNIGCRG